MAVFMTGVVELAGCLSFIFQIKIEKFKNSTIQIITNTN